MKTNLLVLASLLACSQAISLSKMSKSTYSDGPHASVPLPNSCDESKNSGREYMHPVDQDGIAPASLYGPRHTGDKHVCTEGEKKKEVYEAWEHNITVMKNSGDKEGDAESKEGGKSKKRVKKRKSTKKNGENAEEETAEDDKKSEKAAKAEGDKKSEK